MLDSPAICHSLCLPPMSDCLWLNVENLSLPVGEEARLRDWLLDQGSLTRRLTALAQNTFSLRLLTEGWQCLREDECAALGIAPSTSGWVREVLLCGQGSPWVFARSVASRRALQRTGLDLQKLGERPLGELLFCEPLFIRGEVSACKYPAQWLPTAVRDSGLWGRRSCFTQDTLGILVAEVFLPALWQRVDADA